MSILETSRPDGVRVDLQIIASLVEAEARVLDVGCGDGGLLQFLRDEKQIDGRGIEISQRGVNACVSNGLSVIQGDADTDLKTYPDQAFDFAILSQTLQATHRPKDVVTDLLRIGKRAIVSFPNFGYWKVRWSLLARGRMPVTSTLDYAWYETPNIHFCTILDFVALCEELNVTIEKGLCVRADGTVSEFEQADRWTNWVGEQAVFLLHR